MMKAKTPCGLCTRSSLTERRCLVSNQIHCAGCLPFPSRLYSSVLFSCTIFCALSVVCFLVYLYIYRPQTLQNDRSLQCLTAWSGAYWRQCCSISSLPNCFCQNFGLVCWLLIRLVLKESRRMAAVLLYRMWQHSASAAWHVPKCYVWLMIAFWQDAAMML